MELRLEKLSRRYGEKRAVDGVDAVLTPGVYGLLGANGAGKTTLMRMICGVLRPTAGTIRLDGETMDALGERYYSRLGYMPQELGLYPEFTAREFMGYMAAVKGLPAGEARERTEALLELVNLTEAADRPIRSFSGGMKRRLGIAQAELGDPDLLVLDEPTAGLDPRERVRFRNLISDLAREKIVLLSTHIVSDVSSVADRILLMKEGRFLLDAPTAAATESVRGRVWELETGEGEAAAYEARFLVSRLRHENGRARLRIVGDAAPSPAARPAEPDLEDLFLYHFGQSGREEGSEER